MMKIYTWFRHYRAAVNSFLIAIFTSLILDSISGSTAKFYQFSEIIKDVFKLNTFSGFLLIASFVLLVLFNVTFQLATVWLNKQSLSREFYDFMKNHTSPQLIDSIGNGCISWGEGKTVEICNDIIFGWDPSNVLVDAYNDEQYIFYSEEERSRKFGDKSYYFNETDYLDYKNSDTFQETIRKGNNLPRFMLTACSKNFDKHNRKLLLSLARTEWSKTSYVWDRFGKAVGYEVNSNSLMKEYSSGIKSGNQADPYLPNSFCMHLLIETLDNKVVLALISDSKRNDNPGTWAATLGEQLDLEDFTDGNDYYDDFVIRWMQRAFQEEYKLNEAMYTDIVDESSLKCISVDFESDRYNFALFCTVQMRYTYEAFYKKLKVLLSTEEASKLKPISIDDIPSILMTYSDPDKRKEYHPSTYLRLLLYFIHKNGYAKAERLLMNYK